MLKRPKMGSALLGIGVVFALISGLFAGTTGKIAGIVLDGSTGDPLPGVNIILEGTTLGAATDADGQYFVISVPPGNYAVVASFIGYATESVTEVRVNIDRTTHLDFGLEVSAVVGEEVVVTAEREAIRLDVSYSQQALTATEVMATPTGQDLREAIAMGVGIERDLFGHLSIRGGEMDEVGFFVDDFSLSDKRIGNPVIQVPKAAIQEIQILTGGFNAEYGEARSGMINIVTKEGGQDFHGSFEYRTSPKALKHFGPNVFDPEHWWMVGRYLFMDAIETGDSSTSWRGEKIAVWTDENGNDIDHDEDGEPDFKGWNAWFEENKDGAEGATAEECRKIWEWRHRPQEYGHEPDHYAEYTLGGPLPLMGGKLTFFLSGYYDKTMYQFRLPRPAFIDHNQSIKLNYRLSDKISLTLRGGYGETLAGTYDAEPQKFVNPHYFDNVAKAMDGLANGHLYNADSRMTATTVRRNTVGLDLRHMLNPSSFYDLKFHYDRIKYDSSPVPWRDESTVYTTPGGVELDEGPEGFFASKWKDQLEYHRMGEDKGWRDYSWYETYRLRADYTNQVTVNHQLKTGFGGMLNTMYLDYGRDRLQAPWPEDDKKRWENWTKRTVGYLESYAYAQDKIEFEGMIVNVGLRADVFGSQEPVFTDPWSDYYKSTKGESGYSINYDSLYYAPTEDPKLKLALSPRLGISHPITANSKLFFNYGYFFQRGSVENLYTDVTQRTSRLDIMSNPNLDFRKTISYELGVEQNIAGLMSYTLSGYYKDVSREVSSVVFEGIKDIEYERAMNNRYRDIRGFEVQVDVFPTGYLSGWVNYNYMLTSDGWYGWEDVYEDTLENNVLQSPNQDKVKARPWLRTNLMLRIPEARGAPLVQQLYSDLMVSTYIQWRSGEWLTYHSERYPGDEEDNVHWKAWHNVDLNVTKGIRVGGVRLEAYMEVHNLLNSKHLHSNKDFWGQGLAIGKQDDYLELVAELGLEPGEFDDPALEELIDKQFYFMLLGQPRDIWFGLRFSF